MTSRALFALGIGQCVNWGVLYYAFGVLLLPVERDLGVPHWIVAGAFSLALLVSAAAAAAVGRWSDRGYGPVLIEGGGSVAAILLLSWALFPNLATLYIAWAGLGLCMAATLYEPAFAVVGRAHDHPTDRLKALAVVTLFGGLASTLFLPITAVLVERVGWRGAVAWLAVALAISTFVTSSMALRGISARRPSIAAAPDATPAARRDPRFASALLVFSVGSLASAAFTTTLVPALVGRDLPPTTAATLGGLLGIMQLPGRALMMNGTLALSPSHLLVASLLLQAGGLAVLVVAQTTVLLGVGVSLFAIGGGLTTLIRPLLVQTLFGIERAGYLNGSIARSQQLARAAAPVLAVGLASLVGYAAVFAVLATLFAVLAVTFNGAPGTESIADHHSPRSFHETRGI